MTKFRISEYTDGIGNIRYCVERRLLGLFWVEGYYWHNGGRTRTWATSLEEARSLMNYLIEDTRIKNANRWWNIKRKTIDVTKI